MTGFELATLPLAGARYQLRYAYEGPTKFLFALWQIFSPGKENFVLNVWV